LVILEEFQDMEESWKLDLLGSYIFEIENRKKGVKVVHLIVSQESENDLIDKLSDEVSVRENERRTKRQIVEGSFEVVEL